MHTMDSMPPLESTGSKRANSPVLCPPNGSSNGYPAHNRCYNCLHDSIKSLTIPQSSLGMHGCKSLSNVNGHPNQIKNELGMRKVIFHAFVQELQACRLHNSKYITLDEQIAISMSLHLCDWVIEPSCWFSFETPSSGSCK